MWERWRAGEECIRVNQDRSFRESELRGVLQTRELGKEDKKGKAFFEMDTCAFCGESDLVFWEWLHGELVRAFFKCFLVFKLVWMRKCLEKERVNGLLGSFVREEMFVGIKDE